MSFIREKEIARPSFMQAGVWDRAFVCFKGAKPKKLFWLFSAFKAIKRLTMTLKILYSWLRSYTSS